MPGTQKSSLEVLLGPQSTNPALVPQVAATVSLLKDLSLRIMNIVNTKDFTDPVLEYISQDIVGHHDAGAMSLFAVGKDAFLAGWEANLSKDPNLHTDIVDVQTDVEEIDGRATVWVVRVAHNAIDGLKRDVVSEFKWIRREGRWWCTGYRGLRSFSFYQSETLYATNSTTEENEDTPQSKADSEGFSSHHPVRDDADSKPRS